MVALRTGEAERFLAKAHPEFDVVLVFGPDAGLVSERCDNFARAALGAGADALATLKLEGDEVASDPDRLLEEAYASSLFGGRRLVWVRLGSRAVQSAVQRILEGPRVEAPVLIEAGDLKRSHALRSLCERSPRAAALACYPDAAADIGRLIDAELGGEGLTIAPEARAALIALLGADRLASRQEVRKLALYAQGGGRIELADVEAAVADSTATAADRVIDAVFAGDVAAADAALTAAVRAGTSPPALLAAALRQALQLAKLKADAGSRPVRAVVDEATRGMPMQRKAMLESALTRLSAAQLDAAVERLAEAVLETRRRADLAVAVTGRALLALAATGGRARGG